MNMRDRLKASTAGLVPAADRPVEVTPAEDGRPKTGVGMISKLSQAELRIAELEAQLEAHGAQSVIPVSKIRANPWQPRTRFVEAKLRELADNIKEVGLMQPVLVRRVALADGDEYFELIAGERRWRAHQLLEWAEIKAIITAATDAEMAVLAMTENISREGLTDYEISKGLRRAEKEFPDRKRMAEQMGLNRTTLYRYLSFENLPEFMREDLERNPSLFGGNAAHDTSVVLKKHGEAGVSVARDLWKQLLEGGLEQTKFAGHLEGALARRETSPVTVRRDVHKVYAGKEQVGHITKDATSLTLKLKSAVVTPAQEERIRALVSELFGAVPDS